MVESNREPCMAPSGHVPCKALGGGETEERNIHFVGLLQGVCRCRVVNRKLPLVVWWRMSGRSPLSMEDSKDGYNCSRCGGHSYGGSGKEVEETSMSLGDDDNLGEQWFNRENSQAEHRSLFPLEREFDATLRFEHGDESDGGLKASHLWVMRILLGRLFRECLVLGCAVKMYARFQRHEIMRCMVKINDLEELADPPLSGTLG